VICLSTLATATPAEVAATGAQRWFQLYVFRDEGVTRNLVAQAHDGGFSALVLTVDAPVVGRRERDFRTGFTIPQEIEIGPLGRGGVTPLEAFSWMSQSVSWRDVEQLASDSGLPVLVKGVLTREDAVLACEHGAAGIVVSNHGGRQLDGAPASIEALPEVVAAVDGRATVLLDGGIRRGTDVVKALGLGASACLLGRPWLFALAVGGRAGVTAMLEQIRTELVRTLQLMGLSSVAEVGPHVVRRR